MSQENKKSDVAAREEAVLKFWKDNSIFEKSLEKESTKGEFVFYEGPPTANGKPGIHHLEARAFKDVIPRYKTMQGFHVRRKGGWDTHGLPVELQVEKELGLKSKKEIENFGVAEFNKKCKESVWTYLDIWNKFTTRIGYWVDQENPYITYDPKYMESLWNIVKHVSEQKINGEPLLYKDYKVVPWCPRCGTALSSHELAQGYQDDKDLSVYVKLKMKAFDGAYFLAWTTTPWTLPGNVALAVGADIEYVEAKVGEEILVLAKERLSLLSEGYEILATHTGKEMVGMEYEPLYPFLKNNLPDSEKPKLEKAFKVYSADFVNTTDGTGIVHTAVMYGQDDFELGTKIGLPKYHLVQDDGHFTSVVGFLAGKFVKDEDTAVEIIKDLAHRGLLFKKEKYEHSYPHCWRCKTALIYFARDSWYIRMSALRDTLIEENKTINWEPSHIREGRFGEWLKDVKDWAISRERYWGTPLPIWQNEKGEKIVIGSVEELKSKTKKSGNNYFAMRHGYGQHMTAGVVSSLDHDSYHLTEEGKAQVLESAKHLKAKGITKIFSSPLLRTQETAKIVAETLGISHNDIVTDARLREYDFGEWNGKPWQEYVEYRKTHVVDYDQTLGATSLQDVKNRFGEFFYDIESKYKNETVLVVTHGIFFETMPAVVEGADKKRSLEILSNTFKNNRIQPAEVREFNFISLPHNENYELDLHKPYIDAVELVTEKGEVFTRAKEVMDVWFDSGSMPFAQDHYPFENKEWVDTKGYPADYICEAIDQTRGWFYTLHAVGALMGKGKAFKNVICLGHILDEKGKKMSKSLGNIVDPWTMIEKYGVDTLRLWMYSVNQPGDSKNFDEKTVAEIKSKVFTILENVYTFYDLYSDAIVNEEIKGSNVLDLWIIARLFEVIENTTKNMDEFKVFEPVRMMRDFVTDLSTWYIRRSRDRFKIDGSSSAEATQDRQEALHTTRYILLELSKAMAPFAPFFAEELFQKIIKTLPEEFKKESVHLAEWPIARFSNPTIIEEMKTVRQIVTAGLEARQKAGIKVRQPLAKLTVKKYSLSDQYTEILKDELNVKNIVVDESIETEVLLDTEITPVLKAEGQYRDLVRAIQDLRKQKDLSPSDVVKLSVSTNEPGKNFISQFESELKKATSLSEIVFMENEGSEIVIDEFNFKISLK